MEDQALLEQLLDLALELGIEVRREFFDGEGGGFCRIRDKWVLVMDESASLTENLNMVCQALAGREELEEKYVLPQIREALEKYTAK